MKNSFKIKVSNVKLSLKLKDLVINTDENTQLDFFEKYNRIIKVENFTITIYHNNPHALHMTGIKNLCENLDLAIKTISLLSSVNFNYIKSIIRIDNITATCNYYKSKVNLIILFKKIKAKNDVHVRFNPVKFPGMTVKFSSKSGTAIIFESGKINLLGCKNIPSINRLIICTLDLINQNN